MTSGHLFMKRQRAVKEEHKLERKQAILDTAWKIFQTTPYHEVTMSIVAQKTRLAKGTLFLYFPTKEEMFLALLEGQLVEWFTEVNLQLDLLKGKTTIEQVVSLFADSLKARTSFTRLLAIHSTIVEQNVSYESILQHKQIILSHLAGTGTRLESALPYLTKGQGAHFILQAQATVVGLWHLADPSPIASDVIKNEGLDVFNLDFILEFQKMLTALLYGLERISKKS